jgi:hypothetical protein
LLAISCVKGSADPSDIGLFQRGPITEESAPLVRFHKNNHSKLSGAVTNGIISVDFLRAVAGRARPLVSMVFKKSFRQGEIAGF